METQWLPVSLVVWIAALAGTLDARQQARFVRLCTGLLYCSKGAIQEQLPTFPLARLRGLGRLPSTVGRSSWTPPKLDFCPFCSPE